MSPNKYFSFLALNLIITIQVFSGTGFHSNQLKDTTQKNKSTQQFEEIKVNSLPKYEDVSWVIAKSGLLKICNQFKIDQLEKDLMFMKTAVKPYKDFKMLKFKNGSNKKYIEIFPEKNLQLFYETARTVLSDYNKK